MQVDPQITFEGSEVSEAARGQILNEIQHLEIHNQRITACRVKVIAPSHKHRHGTGFQVHIWLTIPPHENIVVSNASSNDSRHEHAESAIKDAFASARRQIDALAA
jgi:ribosome-associated translation inhibitor RaiA